MQSGHWDHQCCTLFAALFHYKDANDCLQHESFVFVSDYMNHDKFWSSWNKFLKHSRIKNSRIQELP